MEFDGSMKDRKIGVTFGPYDRYNPTTGTRNAIADATVFTPEATVEPMPDACNPCDQDNDTYCCTTANEASGCPTPPTGGCGGLCTSGDFNDLNAACRNACLNVDGDGSNDASCKSATVDCKVNGKYDCNDNATCQDAALNEACLSQGCDGKPKCGDGKDNDCDGLIDCADTGGCNFLCGC